MEHQEVPKEHAAAKLIGLLRKPHRGQNLAAGRRQKPKEWTQKNCGYQRKLATARIGLTRHAGVAPRKGHSCQGQGQDNVARRTPKGRIFRKQWRLKPESIKVIGIRDLKKQLYLRSERTSGRIFGKTTVLEIVN
jgi:hypothetical protein